MLMLDCHMMFHGADRMAVAPTSPLPMDGGGIIPDLNIDRVAIPANHAIGPFHSRAKISGQPSGARLRWN